MLTIDRMLLLLTLGGLVACAVAFLACDSCTFPPVPTR